LPALALENEIGNAIIDHLRLRTQQMSLFAVNELSQLQALHDAVDWGDLKPDALLLILNSAQFQAGRIKIELCKAKLADVLGVETSQLAKDLLGFSVPFTLSRRSNQTKIVIGAFKPSPNPSLLHTLKQARFWLDELRKGQCLSEIAIQSKVKPRTLRKNIRLGLLSPKLQKAILTGNHPTHWTVSTFTKTPMPMDWAMQEAQYL